MAAAEAAHSRPARVPLCFAATAATAGQKGGVKQIKYLSLPPHSNELRRGLWTLVIAPFFIPYQANRRCYTVLDFILRW